ncbi:MAG: sigma-70 family RNA polymerase sigma factor [Butyricimonas paravirosa]
MSRSLHETWEQRKEFDKIGDTRKYLQYAIRNSSLNYLKHQRVVNKYQQEYIRQAAEDEDSPEEYLHLVQRLLELLPEKRKKVLELSIVESKSYSEIAEILNISVNTVKDHIKRAYAFLREKANKEVSELILYLILTINK